MRNKIYAFLNDHPIISWILILFCPITATLYWIFVVSELIIGIIEAVELTRKIQKVIKGVG